LPDQIVRIGPDAKTRRTGDALGGEEFRRTAGRTSLGRHHRFAAGDQIMLERFGRIGPGQPRKAQPAAVAILAENLQRQGFTGRQVGQGGGRLRGRDGRRARHPGGIEAGKAGEPDLRAVGEPDGAAVDDCGDSDGFGRDQLAGWGGVFSGLGRSREAGEQRARDVPRSRPRGALRWASA
jgi:hypothetical protein